MSGSVIHRKRRWWRQGCRGFLWAHLWSISGLGTHRKTLSQFLCLEIFLITFCQSILSGVWFWPNGKQAKRISFQLLSVTSLSASPSVVSQTEIGYTQMQFSWLGIWAPDTVVTSSAILTVSSLVTVSFPFNKHWSGTRSCARCWKGRQDYKTCLRPLISLPLNFSCVPNNDGFIQPSRSNHRHRTCQEVQLNKDRKQKNRGLQGQVVA